MTAPVASTTSDSKETSWCAFEHRPQAPRGATLSALWTQHLVVPVRDSGPNPTGLGEPPHFIGNQHQRQGVAWAESSNPECASRQRMNIQQTSRFRWRERIQADAAYGVAHSGCAVQRVSALGDRPIHVTCEGSAGSSVSRTQPLIGSRPSNESTTSTLRCREKPPPIPRSCLGVRSFQGVGQGSSMGLAQVIRQGVDPDKTILRRPLGP